MESLNWLDYLILTVVGLSMLFSLVRGFAREVISLAAWVAASLVSLRFMVPVSALFIGIIETEALRWTAAFLTLFVGILLVGSFLKLLFGRFIRKAELGAVDRFLGLVFGFVRGSLMVVVVFFLFRITTMVSVQDFKGSQLLPHFDRISAWMIKFLPTKPKLTQEEVLKMNNVSDQAKLDLLIEAITNK